MIVLYPSLLAVGGVTHDMCACIVRQDYTGAHFHALGWTSPQRLFILRHLRRERNPKFKLTREILQCYFLWNFFTLYILQKCQRHLCVGLIISCFLFKKKAHFYRLNLYFINDQIFSAIYEWIFQNYFKILHRVCIIG